MCVVRKKKQQLDVVRELGYEFPHRKCHKRTDKLYTFIRIFYGGAFESFLLRLRQWTKTNNKQMRSIKKAHEKKNKYYIALIGHFEVFKNAVTFVSAFFVSMHDFLRKFLCQCYKKKY